MREFGEYLKTERESRNISLDEISLETKIRLDYLEAIEEGELSRLPGEFYSRTYIRAYAKVIGLPEDVVMEKYRILVEKVEAEGEGVALPSGKKWDGTLQSTVASKGEAPKKHLNRRVILVLLVIVLLLIGAIFILDYIGYFDESVGDPSTTFDTEPQVDSQSLANNTTEAKTETPVEEDLEEDEDSVGVLDGDLSDEIEDTPDTQMEDIIVLLDVSLRSSGECWYEIRDENNSLIRSGILQNGQAVTVSRSGPLVIALGKPDVITLVINGQMTDLQNDVRELIVDNSGAINIVKRW
ncbi:MAG: DUF4115 domain-containing protein [Firmicutes bacterium]|nr:DUF4115 domain-containing protein [Bacillota bacterium]MDD4263104.1 DUF4115 domain-containing protein [Bacillota bacterium]MDD4693423.1 DUF4115 domain-containing protein [Bacillota bacterium]